MRMDSSGSNIVTSNFVFSVQHVKQLIILLHVTAVLVPRVFPLKFGRETPEKEVVQHSSVIVS